MNIILTIVDTGAHELNSEAFSNLAYEYQPPTGTDAYAAVNVLNQYPTVTPAGQSAQSIAYDGDGNLTSGGGWTYSYDAENKMMSACNASPCGGASVSAAYAYDPLGRRTEKSGTGVATTFFLNDGSDEIAEYDSLGDVLRRFVPGSAINEPVVYEDCTGATAPNCTGSGPVDAFFHTDHHGSVVELSKASAAPVNSQPYVYDAYGNNPGMALTGEPFRYVGMYIDAETGLYYDRARYYSPSLGRFMQTDPIGYSDDLDMYAYVGNDPIDRIDPTGLSCTVTNNVATECHIDDKSKLYDGVRSLEERHEMDMNVKAFEKRYTALVNKLLSSSASTDLKLPGLGDKAGSVVSTPVTAREIGGALASRKISYDGSLVNPNTKNGVTTVTRSMLEKNAAPEYGGVRPGGIGSDITLVHEGFHGSDVEKRLVGLAGGTMNDLGKGNAWGDAHQPFYDEAAIGLYGTDQ